MPIPDTGRIRATELLLSINNAQPEDSGNYTCIAHNMAATHAANVHVIVSGELGWIGILPMPGL
jgi:hypothetical protein